MEQEMTNEGKRFLVDFNVEGGYGTNDMYQGFDHSYGVFMGDGLFCWPNRFGGKTFANSNEDGKIDLLIYERADGRFGIHKKADLTKADDEHKKDGCPTFQTPTPFDLFRLMRILVDWVIADHENPEDFAIDYLLSPYRAVNKQLFISRAKEMAYGEFVQTPYWKIVSAIVKKKHPRCQLCGSTKNLEVHHLTYEHHGDELHHLEDLTVLCHDCHAKFHEKK